MLLIKQVDVIATLWRVLQVPCLLLKRWFYVCLGYV